jgi:hypothetical protein
MRCSRNAGVVYGSVVGPSDDKHASHGLFQLVRIPAEGRAEWHPISDQSSEEPTTGGLARLLGCDGEAIVFGTHQSPTVAWSRIRK